MGAFNAIPQNITIKEQPGWEPGEQVELKGCATTADMDAITAGTQAGRKVQVMLERMVLDWTFTTAQGNKVEVKPNAIARLTSRYTLPLIQAIEKIANDGMTQEQISAFLFDVSGQSSGN